MIRTLRSQRAKSSRRAQRSCGPSPGSRANRHFAAANGDHIRNKGQAVVRGRVGKRRIASTFQVADVSRALYSVSKICDDNCEVHFTKTEGRVTRDGKVIAVFLREGGLYVAPITIGGDEGGGLASTFVGQGPKQ